MKGFSIIVAATQKGGIGKDGNLPWRLPKDMAFFKQTTSAAAEGRMNAVILGRKTWESIPKKFRPLPSRMNIVLTRKPGPLNEELKGVENTHVKHSLAEALAFVRAGDAKDQIDKIFVIGGGMLYKEAVAMADCSTVYLTTVLKDISCDTFFPALDPRVYELAEVGEVQIQKDIPFQFNTYTRKATPVPMQIAEAKSQHAEYQYLNLIRKIIDTGNNKGDRTGTGTRSIFGAQMRFSLRESFPLLTTKRVFWRGVVEELLWLIGGSTSSKELSRKRVKIWDGNGTRNFLDKYGHGHREEGDLGPVYGHQWRHFGATYVDCHTDYSGQGVDQLKNVIETIKANPNDRRIIMSAWNPCDLKTMALPPCHVLAQFYVANGEVSCMMYQRSCDMGLGVPFNVASYSLLTCMIAQVCGLKAGEFIHTLGDAHVYNNHIGPLEEQLQRTPRAFPTLKINKNITDIEEFTLEDLQIENYKPQKTIKMEMAV